MRTLTLGIVCIMGIIGTVMVSGADESEMTALVGAFGKVVVNAKEPRLAGLWLREADANVAANTMKYSQNHNLRVPLVATGAARPAPANPAPVAVVPDAKGDAVSFSAMVKPGSLWPDHYRVWTRRFDSPSPAEIVVTDELERVNGPGVEFRWHTPLPVTRRDDGRIVLQGARGRAVLIPPEGTSVDNVPPRELGCRRLSTIVFRHPAALRCAGDGDQVEDRQALTAARRERA